VDENVTIDVKVKNIGESTASSICKIFFEIDNGIKRLFIEPGYIYANQEYTFTQQVTFSEKGKFKVKVVADYYKKVAESDETNNEKEVEIEVGGSNIIFTKTETTTPTIIFTKVTPATSTVIFFENKETDPNGPDLLIELFKTFPDQPQANMDVKIGVRAYNKGKSKSPGTWIHLSSPALPSGLKIHIMPIPVMGSSGNYLTTKFTESGTFKITAIVDQDNKIVEANESNNTKSITVDVLPEPKADLVIGNITVDPASPEVGVQFKVKAEIKNIGEAKSAPCSLTFGSQADIRLSFIDVPAIKDGGSKVIELTAREMKVKTYRYKFAIDARNDVNESNENNNTKEKLIDVIGPDLEIELITTFPEKPIYNKEVEIGVKVRNKGKSKSPETSVHLSSPALPSGLKMHIMPIAASGTYANKIKTKFSDPGTFTVTATVDQDNKIIEVDENNNTKSITVNVIPELKADLEIGKITVIPASPEAGVQYKVKAVIKNIGEAKSTPCSLMVDSEAGMRYSYLDVPAIGKGKSKVIEWTAKKMEAGHYIIKLVIDARNEVDESNENNNTKEKNIDVH
ncbi:MAG: hypothetical protein JW737_06660, partial [Acidobacteria bacterium]|nr:hypothetical protein [Acidobacteriota bacterium]